MSAKGSRPSSRGTKAPSGSRAAVKTPPEGSKRPPVKPDSAAREVVRGREVEFWGVGCISLGIVLVLSMYLHMAGPLGRAIDTTFGWLLGLGRFALPMVVTGIGVAMVRRRSIQHRLRLTMGWTIIRQLQHITVSCLQNMIRCGTHHDCKFCVRAHVAILAMNWHKPLRLQDGVIRL